MLFEKGTLVFLPDETDCWVPARVATTFEKGKQGAVTVLDGERAVRLSPKHTMECQPMDEQSLRSWDDMVLLKQLDNASLLHNLRLRYAKDTIYTNIGTILISVNPYKLIPELFGPEMTDRFIGCGGNLADLPPHIFGVAEDSYFQMMTYHTDQSCIITGESGAGKTEATKLYLQYIAERSRRMRGSTVAEDAMKNKGIGGVNVPIREQILEANPLMEAFGNAKTVRNDNSSRFGKLIDLQFDRSQGSVVGGGITNYLLEKSRVVRHLEGERSYHIFYQLCAAANQLDESLKKKYHLGSADNYFFLNQSKAPSTMIDGVDDAREWEETMRAMTVLRMDEKERDSVIRILSAILHLGNIDFSPKGNTDFAQVTSDSTDALNEAAAMFGVQPAELKRGLLTRDISNKTETVIQNHNVREARESRDALAKHTYSRLFNWLTTCINRALSSRIDEVNPNNISTISVLDIFGFESFGHNSFEQLCINYCNEKLQGFFNNHIFKLEQEEYRREEIDVSQIGFSDNEGVILTIDHRTDGIFAICDDQVNLLRGTDDGFYNKVLQHAKQAAARVKNNSASGGPGTKTRKKSMTEKMLGAANRSNSITSTMAFLNKGNPLDDKVFLKEPDVKEMRRNPAARKAFIIVHFAGEVMYNVEGFLEKNRDILRNDLLEVVASSDVQLIATLFESDEEDMPTTGRKKNLQRKTLGRKFQEQLDTLMMRLGATEPHFVRTIKPNSKKKPGIFEAPLVLDQLRYAGLLEVCRIRQMGYPVRKDHDEFFSLFCCIHPEAKDLDDLIACLLKDGLLQGSDWQKGKTKMFMRAGQFDALSKERESALWDVTVMLQRQVRRFLARNKYLRTKTVFDDLRRGVDERDKRLLERSIPFAAQLPTARKHTSLLERARRVLAEIKEEEKLIEMITSAVAARDVDALPSLIASAEDMNLGGQDVVKQAKELVARDRQVKRAIEALQNAIESRSVSRLTDALEQASELGLQNSTEAQTARALLDRLEEEARLIDELDEAIAVKDINRMGELIQALVNIGAGDHPSVEKAQRMVKRIIKESEERKENLQRLYNDLEAAIDARDLEALNALRIRIEELNAKGDLVDRAMELRRMLEARKGLLHKLAVEQGILETKARSMDGISEDDLDPLSDAIENCKDHELSEVTEPALRDAVLFLRRMKRQLEVQDMLVEALDEMTFPKLLAALLAAQALAMETANARRVAEEVRMLEKIRLGLSMIDQRKRRDKRLSMLRYATKDQKDEQEKVRQKNTKTDKYQSILDDTEGVSKYDLANYYRIRDDDDYVESFPYAERDDQAALKLWSTKNPIPKSVHEVDDEQNVLAVRCNRCILQYCGDLGATNTAALAQYVVVQGMCDDRLADEIYIQLLKHLRGNVSKSSEDKAWLLLCMCTKYFPSSDMFTPYLLHFLLHHREYPGLIGNYARLCVAQLEPTIILSAGNFKPSLEEIGHYAMRPPVLCNIQVPNGELVSLPVSPDMRLEVVTKLVREATGIMDAVNNPAWAIFCRDTGEKINDGLRDRLVRFYKQYNRAKLAHIEVYVSHWQGREEELFDKLVQQYGPEPVYATEDGREARPGQSGNGSKAAGLALPITVARAAGKLLKGVQNGKVSGPAPKVAWPLPGWVFPGDVWLRMTKQRREPTFVYKRRVLPAKGKADIELFQQLRSDYLAGSLVTTDDYDVALLAAIPLCLKNPNLNLQDDSELIQCGLAQEIPKDSLVEKPIDVWARKVTTDVDLPTGGDQRLRELYCETLSKCATYGMSLYHARRADSNRDYVLGVDRGGIHILDPSLEAVVKSFPHKAIKKYGATAGTFWLKVSKSKLETSKEKISRRVSRRFGATKPADIKQTTNGLAAGGKFDFLKRNDGIDIVLHTLTSWELFDNVFVVQRLIKEREDKVQVM